MAYKDKFTDPRWQKFRLEVFQSSDFTCCICDSHTEELHAHHMYYIKGRDPWDYPDGVVFPLCKHCHKKFHDTKQATEQLWADIPSGCHRMYTALKALGMAWSCVSYGKDDPLAARHWLEESKKWFDGECAAILVQTGCLEASSRMRKTRQAIQDTEGPF